MSVHLLSGIRFEILEDGSIVATGSTGDKYEVSLYDPDKPNSQDRCSCRGFAGHRHCRHLTAALNGIRELAPDLLKFHLHPYWAVLPREAVCVEGTTIDDAERQVQEIKGVKPTTIRPLPYPADRRISVVKGNCPSFCHSPRQCAGHSSCPMSYACSE